MENPLTDPLVTEQRDDLLAPLEFFDDFDDVHMVGCLVERLVMAGRLVIVGFLVLVGIPVRVGFPVMGIFDGSAICPSCIGFPVGGIFFGVAVSVAVGVAVRGAVGVAVGGAVGNEVGTAVGVSWHLWEKEPAMTIIISLQGWSVSFHHLPPPAPPLRTNAPLSPRVVEAGGCSSSASTVLQNKSSYINAPLSRSIPTRSSSA